MIIVSRTSWDVIGAFVLAHLMGESMQINDFVVGFSIATSDYPEGIQWDSLIFRIDTCQRCFNDFDVPIFEKSRPCFQCCKTSQLVDFKDLILPMIIGIIEEYDHCYYYYTTVP